MEWKTVKLGDCLSKIIDNRGKTPKDLAASGHPLLEINAVSKNNKYPLYGEAKKYVDDVVYSTWFRSGHPQYGDILVPTVGTLGAVAYVDRNDCCIAQNLIALRANADICDNAYIYYLLCNPQIVKRLLNLDIGAVQASIKVPHLLALEISLPPLETQRRIAAILSSLDDKIENNNRINRNLEAQAQALFKSWFVDFEPWGCIMPEDWKEGTLGDIIDEQPKSKVQVNAAKDVRGKYPFFTSGNSIYEYTEALVSGRNVYLNTGGAAGIEFYVGEAAYSTDTWCIKGMDDFTDFLYLYLSSIKEILDAEYFEGSALKHLKKKPLKERKIIIPTHKTIDDFNKMVVPLFDIIMENYSENKRLATLRDTLLPKLMRGEITL